MVNLHNTVVYLCATLVLAGLNITTISHAQTQTAALQNINSSCPAITTDPRIKILDNKISTRADNITHLKNGDVELEGDVHILRKRYYFRADKAFLNKEQTKLEVHNANYTRCSENNRVWHFKAKRIVINHEKNSGVLYHGVLYFYKVPVLYLPIWWFVPDKSRRATQFLPPKISDDSDEGLTWQQKFFINLAPHYDLTLGMHFIEARGPAWYADFNYNTPNHKWRIYASDLEKDRLEERLVRRGDNTRRTTLGHRGLYHVSHSSARANGLSLDVNYTKLTDPYYGEDFSLAGTKDNDPLYVSQRAILRWQNPEWNMRLLSSSDQAINDGQPLYRLEPSIAIDYTHTAPSFRPEYSIQTRYTEFNHPESGFVEGARWWNNITIAYPMQWAGFSLRPWLGRRWIRQSQDLQPTYEASASSAGMDARLRFERNLNKTQQAHTLETRFFYLYHRLEEQELPNNYDTSPLEFSAEQVFRETRLSGHDYLDDTNHLGIGLAGTITSLRSGREWLRGSINQIFYGRDRRIGPNGVVDTRSYSSVVSEIEFLNEYSSVRNEITWNTQTGNIDNSESHISYHSAERASALSLTHRYNRNDPSLNQKISQLRMLWEQRLSARWRLNTSLARDLRNDWDIGIKINLEYRACCFRVSVGWERDQDDGPEYTDTYAINFGF